MCSYIVEFWRGLVLLIKNFRNVIGIEQITVRGAGVHSHDAHKIIPQIAFVKWVNFS